MDLKDKLNLLWKYLFLAVVLVLGILLLTRRSGYDRGDRHFRFRGTPRGYLHLTSMPDDDLREVSEVRVEKQIINGDTIVVVWVNGEEIDNPEEFLKIHERGFTSVGYGELELEDEHGRQMKKSIRLEIHENDN